MKQLKLIAVLVGFASVLLSGCKSSSCCPAGASEKASCGMACCTDAKTDCAHCAKCSAHK